MDINYLRNHRVVVDYVEIPLNDYWEDDNRNYLPYRMPIVRFLSDERYRARRNAERQNRIEEANNRIMENIEQDNNATNENIENESLESPENPSTEEEGTASSDPATTKKNNIVKKVTFDIKSQTDDKKENKKGGFFKKLFKKGRKRGEPTVNGVAEASPSASSSMMMDDYEDGNFKHLSKNDVSRASFFKRIMKTRKNKKDDKEEKKDEDEAGPSTSNCSKGD